MHDSSPDDTPILIGGGELGRCPTRIHHHRFSRDTRPVDPVVERRIADGRAWEAEVVDRLLPATDRAEVSSPHDAFDRDLPVVIPKHVDPGEREAITAIALGAGVPLLFGGRIAAPDVHSVGEPDVLLRLSGGYAPIEIKRHKIIGPAGIPARFAPLDRLADVHGPRRPFRPNRSIDLLQVAHYWTLLDRLGMANPRHLAGVIGADLPAGCLWVDLDAGRSTILDRYATALSEAVAVVKAGTLTPDLPLVPPVWRGECRGCPWAPLCRAELEAVDHVSLLPSVRSGDTQRLLRAGITTTSAIARLTPDDLPDDLNDPREAVLQARARAAGAILPRSGADLALPDEPLEIDFDVETYHGILYLAGILVNDGGTSRYRPFTDWTGTPDGERRVLSELFAFFDGLADRGGFVVYHWTGYERTILKEASLRHGVSLRSAPDVDSWFDRHACDLWAWTKQRFVSPNGYSLKVIAPLCGFEWRDDDPGGAQSEIWYSDLLAGDRSQQRRLLEYNEDDVVAQLAIRRWVRTGVPRRSPSPRIG